MREKSVWSEAKCSRGSALIVLVALVVLVIALIMAQQWFNANQPNPDVTDMTPWKEWRLRENSQNPVALFRPEQVKITRVLEYRADVEMPASGASDEAGMGQPRGEIHFLVNPEGLVMGQWSGSYNTGKGGSCDIQVGKFEGKIYPGRTYEDATGRKDETKVYFLARGRFSFLELSQDGAKNRIRTGDIYVRGWIGEKFAADGEIIITSDEKYVETFRWGARWPEGN